MKHYFLIILLIFSLSCQQNKEIKSLKLAHTLDVKHPVHLGMVHMAELLAKKSDGQLTIKIYPSGQLGGERETLELLQIGSLAMTKVSAAVMENFAPNYRVLGLPYIFKDVAHSHEVLDGEIGQKLLRESEKYKLLGLCFYDAGSRSFYTKNESVEQPSDLEGQKIRVMKSNTAVNMVKALGGSPSPISFGELYTALQQGVVDGAENNPPSFYTSRHYEVCKYYSLDEHTTIPDVLLISTDWWKLLSEQQQKWVRDAANESVAYQRIKWAESEQESLAELEKAGVVITRPDKTKFIEQVEQVYEAYEDDKEKYELIQKIRGLQ